MKGRKEKFIRGGKSRRGHSVGKEEYGYLYVNVSETV